MATLPTVPSFVAGDTSITKLQQLSAAVGFLCDDDIRPTWHIYATSTQAISATTFTTRTFDSVIYDNDGVYVSPGVTIVTQGYYMMETCIPISHTAASSRHAQVYFLFTAGANNPHFTAGTTLKFGASGFPTSSVANEDFDIVARDICPNVLFPGDKIAVQAWTDAAATFLTNSNASYISGRFVPNFTGQWLANGS